MLHFCYLHYVFNHYIVSYPFRVVNGSVSNGVIVNECHADLGIKGHKNLSGNAHNHGKRELDPCDITGGLVNLTFDYGVIIPYAEVFNNLCGVIDLIGLNNVESGGAAGALGVGAFVKLEGDVIVCSVVVAGGLSNVGFGDFADIAFALNGEVCLDIGARVINGSLVLFEEGADKTRADGLERTGHFGVLGVVLKVFIVSCNLGSTCFDFVCAFVIKLNYLRRSRGCACGSGRSRI